MSPGTQVRIVRGPLTGCVGVVAELGSKVVGVRVPSSTPYFTTVVGFARSDLKPLDKLADVEEALL